jgi:hypothetical protein
VPARFAEEVEPLDRCRAQEGHHAAPQAGHEEAHGDARAHAETAQPRVLPALQVKSIQAAITNSRNNDRVVVMPGKYLESKSRAQPTNDPKCAQDKEESDDGQGAATYRYQVGCPNDQNLHPRDRRLPDVAGEVLLQQGVRRADVRLRPRAHHRLRGRVLLYELYIRAAGFESLSE